MDKTIKQIKGTHDEPLIKQMHETGGEIIITTNMPDRSKDRVFTNGISTSNYMANPVILDNHNIEDSVSNIIGKTVELKRLSNSMSSVIELRPAANEFDPQNIILLLWREKYVNASSIRFIPTVEPEINDFGGFDFIETELLEASLVLIPDNQGTIRMAYDGVTRYGQKMVCGIGEICKSGELSEESIKSVMKDLSVKKFPVNTDLKDEQQTKGVDNLDDADKSKKEKTMTDKSAEVVYIESTHVSDKVDDTLGIFKSLNSKELTKEQAKFILSLLFDDNDSVGDNEIEKIIDTSTIGVEFLNKDTSTPKTYTQEELEEIVNLKVDETIKLLNEVTSDNTS
jgi:hypothetical protein